MSPHADDVRDRFPGARPELTVVIASVNGYRYISQCLASLASLEARDRAEVIVVEGSGDNTAERIIAEYPWAVVLPSPTPKPIPQLRAQGIRAARASIVVTTEDHCVFAPDWFQRILEAHRRFPDAAIGGAVENGACDRMVDWAAYICEYGDFMLPIPADANAALPGPNVSYKREPLEAACADLLDRGVWENVLHERLADRGQGLRSEPSIVVYHAKIFGFGHFLAQRYYFGRSFAAERVKDKALSTRLFYFLISPILPPLFLVRYARSFIGKGRFVKQLVATLPLQLIFALGWSVGEFMGYGFGDGGASLRVK